MAGLTVQLVAAATVALTSLFKLCRLAVTGLEAECRIKRPVQPHMFVMLPRSKLKALLYKGIQLAAARQEELADGLHA